MKIRRPAKPWVIKRWAIAQLEKRSVKGYPGKSWWGVPDEDIAWYLGLTDKVLPHRQGIAALDRAFSDATGEKVPKKTRPPKPRDEFLASYEWRKLRMEAIKKYGLRCQCCGSTPKHGVAMHVDHIKPRRKYPELALDINNLQILCEVCNHGKGNWDETDWRLGDEERAHLREIMLH